MIIKVTLFYLFWLVILPVIIWIVWIVWISLNMIVIANSFDPITNKTSQERADSFSKTIPYSLVIIESFFIWFLWYNDQFQPIIDLFK